MLFLTFGVKKLREIKVEDSRNFSSFSIIIPFRNEASNLLPLLESLKKLDYFVTNFEIILVNDASTDNSEEIVAEFIKENTHLEIKLLQHQHEISPKKEAIEKALKVAKYDWIITTDADCLVPEKWLKSINNFIQNNNCDMVVAPVRFSSNHSLFQDFQQLDFYSLMSATQGGFGIGFPFLCNGANLCYKKSVFLELNGFEGNKCLASGDDIFLMEKFLKRKSTDVKYLKSCDAIILTKPQKDILNFVNQRIRWASKTTAYKNNSGKVVGFIVLSMNLLLFFSVLFMFLKSIYWIQFLTIWILKIGVDYLLLSSIIQFYRTKISVRKYLFFSFVYPFYVIIIGILSLKKGYQWKGRKYLR